MATTSARPEPVSGVARAHRLLALFFLAGAVVQFFLAGLGVFGETSYDAHQIWGGVLTVVSLVVLILALVGRREALQSSVILLVLMIVQNIIGGSGFDAPLLGAFHPVVGLAVLGAAGTAASGTRFGPPHGAR